MMQLDETQAHDSVYMPDVGTVEGPVYCGVCGAKMLEHRNQHGPTSWLMGISGQKRYYDFFCCPDREEAWHIQVVELRKMKRTTPSAFIAAILEQEIELILQTKTPTKVT